jgi:hypothetical protein
MDNLPDHVRKAFELYINGDKKEAFEALIPGSDYHSYLHIVDSFKNLKGKLTNKLKDMVAKFVKTKKDSMGLESERLELQCLLLQYDQAKTKDERTKIIKQIDSNFIHGYYEYSKPADLKGVLDKRSRSRSRSRSCSPSSTQAVRNIFWQDKYFNEDLTLKEAYKSDEIIGLLQRSLLNKVDYSKLSERTFTSFLTMCSHLADLTTPSFMERMIQHYKDMEKKNKHYAIPCTVLDKLTLEQLDQLSKACPNVSNDKGFIGKRFSKRYHFELDDMNKENFTLEERRSQLEEMY